MHEHQPDASTPGRRGDPKTALDDILPIGRIGVKLTIDIYDLRGFDYQRLDGPAQGPGHVHDLCVVGNGDSRTRDIAARYVVVSFPVLRRCAPGRWWSDAASSNAGSPTVVADSHHPRSRPR